MRQQNLAITLCFFALNAFAHDDLISDLKKKQPKVIRELIDRRIGCNHWTGENPYDSERRQQINSALKALKCKQLDKDEAAARRRFVKRPDTLKALQVAKETVY